MMRNLPVVSILVLSACSRNALPKRVQDESWKQDFITCTNEATEGVPAEPEANNILLRSARAYDALQSYAGSINVESTADYEARVFSETRRLKVFFQKPSNLFSALVALIFSEFAGLLQVGHWP
jgi:hypothetical protein